VSVTEVDDGLVLLDERDSRYWHLNGMAGRMLRELLDGHSPEETAARLTSVPPGTPPAQAPPGTAVDAVGVSAADESFLAQVTADVRTLVDGLHRAKLVNR
jgi:hypothetical protein